MYFLTVDYLYAPTLTICRSPSSSPTELMTLHASSLIYFQQIAEVAKVSRMREMICNMLKEKTAPMLTSSSIMAMYAGHRSTRRCGRIDGEVGQ